MATTTRTSAVDELATRLANRALAIVAPCLREEEQQDAYDEFVTAFREEVMRPDPRLTRPPARLL